MSFPYFIKLQIDKLPKSLKWSIVFIQYLQIGLLINGWLSWGVKLLRGNFKNENGVFSPSTISLRTVNQMKFKRLIHDFFPLYFTRYKLAFALFKKTIQHFSLFPKLIRKMPIFSQNRVKPYSSVFKEPIVTF